jgi:hypothetical protein
VSAFKTGEWVRFRESYHSISVDDDYVICDTPDQRGAHLLTWVRKATIGALQSPIGVRALWLRRVEGAA